MDAGTALFLRELNSLADADLDGPSTLPDWTRRHVVAHVHFNACALMRLVSWAATGVERRMYESPQQRSAEIEEGARWPAADLRERVSASAGQLGAAFDALPARARQAQVVTAQGRTVPASDVLWLRAREVMVHAVDLSAGLTFDDLPADFTAALMADVVRKRAFSDEGPQLAAWLTGRSSHPPPLGPWL